MYKFLLAFLLAISTLSAAAPELKNNPFLTKRSRQEITPFLIPKSHPLKTTLETIFSHERATLNEEAFANAGFVTLFSQPRSFIKVARHPLLPGCLLKAVLDSEPRNKKGIPCWEWFVRRCIAAKMIEKVIKKRHFTFFKVPKKYLYTLPVHPDVPEGYSRQITVLLVEEMDVVSWEKNLDAWRNKLTKAHLDELFYILTHAPGITVRPDNIVYMKNGKFAFVDTEYSSAKPHINSIKNYMSEEMAAYWDKLCSKR